MVTITKIKPGDKTYKDYAKTASAQSVSSGSTGKVTITKIQQAAKPAAPASTSSTTTANKTGSAYAPRSTSQWREVGGGRVSTKPAAQTSSTEKTFWYNDRNTPNFDPAKADTTGHNRIWDTLKAGVLSEVSNQANNIGVGYDARGGSTMAAGVYKDQALMLQQQVDAARAGLNDKTLSAMDRADLERALKDSENQLAIIQKATGAEKQVAPAMYQASDTAASKAEAAKRAASTGLGKVGRDAVDVGAGLTQFALQEAADKIILGLGTAARATSLSGLYSRAYRQNAGAQYDPNKAARAGTIAGAGVVAGAALSSAVSAAGLNVLKAFGKQNSIPANILKDGASGAAYMLGQSGAGEASNYATYPGYKTDPKALAENMAWAFAFGAIHSAIRTVSTSAQNKAYAQKLNEQVSQRYEMVKDIMGTGTPEQKAQGASSVMDGVEKLRAALNDMQFIGAQKQVDSINQFLNSIDAEMAQYIPVTSETPTSAQGSLAAAPVPTPAAPEPSTGEIIPEVGKPAVMPPSAAPEFTPEDYANIEAEPQEDYLGAAISENTIPKNEDPTFLIPVANTLGQSGKKYMMALYDDDVDTDLYAKDFLAAYNAGLNGKTRPTENYISLGKAVAAYTAGQNDAKAKAPAPKEMTLDEAFSAFNDGGIINEEKVAQDVANGTFPQIEESAEESVPAEHTIVEEEPASGKVDKLGDTIPDTATTEKAEAALSTAIKMPIKGTNQNALLQGIVTGELSMQSVTFGNSVQGFSDEQRKSLARQIIEGRHSSGKSIKIDVPYDGQFSITNKPEAIVEVLDRLNVRAIQETIFDAQADKILKGAKKTAIFKDQNGGKYLSEGYILLPVTDAAVDYAVSNYKAYEYPFPAHMAAALESPYTPITTPPRIFQKGKNISYVFDLPNGAQRLIPKQVAQKLDGGKFYISNPANKVCFIKSVDKNGSVLGYCLTNQQPEHIDTTALQIAPGRSFTRNMLSEEAPANKPSGAAKPKTPGVQTTKNKEGNDNGTSGVDEGRGDIRGGSAGDEGLSETGTVEEQGHNSERSGDGGNGSVPQLDGASSGDDGTRTGSVRSGGSSAGSVSGGNESGAGAADGKGSTGLSEKVSVKQPKRNKNNYRITEDIDSTRPNFNDNLEAIKLVKKLESEGRKATEEERAILARYKGWGSLKQEILGWRSRELKQYMTPEEYEAAKDSILNAHYTSTKVIAGMYKAVQRMGFTGGNILEPSMGVGNFFGMLPKSLASDSTLHGVELDNITGLIAKYLYPDADIHVAGFQDVLYPDNTFDLVVGNVPFSNDIKIPYRGTSFNLHDFFFIKALDETKQGGVVALITSTGTLDKISGKTQAAISKRANLLAAFRLPDNAFKTNAGTSVTTDLIFLQKKGSDAEDNGVEFTRIGEIDGIPVNEYFVKHPENILGELAYEKNMYATERVAVHATDDFEKRFDKAMNSLPKEIMGANAGQVSPVKAKRRGAQEKKTFRVTGEGAEIVNADGNAEKISGQNAGIIREFLKIKQAYFSVIEAERSGNLAAADDFRKRLNTVYDSFVKNYGSMTSNKSLLKQDDDFTRVSGLEVVQDKATAIKSAIFSLPTVSKARKTSAGTSEEALSITLNENGKVDLDRMAQLTGKTKEAILDELNEELILTSDGEYVLTSQYLSGNIYEKLAAVEGREGFEKQAALLKATIPAPKLAKDISAEFGSHWIPAHYVAEFINYAFKSYGNVRAEYSKELGQWEITRFPTSVSKYSTDRVPPSEIVRSTLNGKNITVYDKTEDDRRILNKKATEAAQQKQNDLRQEFRKWVFEDAKRRADLENIFNRTLNACAPMQYKGLSERIDFGISPESKIKLRDYQKEAVARIVYGGNTLLHHGVGTGKTATMISAAHVLKQTGIANKPMFVVPNGKVNDFRNEILDMYPYANVLALDDKSMTPSEIQRTKSMIATGDYDYVIIYRTAFQKISVSPETEAAFIQAQLDDMEQAIRNVGGDKNGRTMFEKNLITRKKTLEEKLKSALDKPKDQSINFEDTGIDALFIDEAHNFKKVGFTTTHSISGIDSGTNNITTDLYMKENYLRNRGGRIVLATATPLTNTLSEMYNMTMHVAPEALRDVGIYSFDGWLNTFADIQSQPEIAPDGKTWRIKERVRGFKSGNELIGIYRQFADVKQTKDVVKGLPKAEYVDVVCEGTDIHQALLDSFADRAGKKDPKDGMLTISNDGRAAGTDLRLLTSVMQDLYPGITDDDLDIPGSKINSAVIKILDEYNRSAATNGTQFVFLDVGVHDGGKRYTFNLYSDLINKLVSNGIPRNEIANIQDYDGEVKRTQLYEAMNTGKVRVLIGSTAKMGEGVNAQNKVVALHHLNVPFRPDNLEQREGRAIRFGNENGSVRIYRYIQEKSFDSYLWQMIERKAAYVAQALNGGDASQLEENSEAIVNAREAKAIATGNPLIMEKFTLQDKVNRLKMLQSSFFDEQRRAAQNLASLPDALASTKRILSAAKKDAATVEKNKTDEFKIKIGSTVYDNRKEAGEALLKVKRTGKIGELYGLDIYREADGKVLLRGEQSYPSVELSESPDGSITRIMNATAAPDKTVGWSTLSIREKEASIEDTKETVAREFTQQEELDKAVARLFEVDTELGVIQNEVNFDETAVAEVDDEGDDEDLVDADQGAETVSQEISSAKTSIKQIPALFKDKNVQFGKVNIDIGGGKYDLATEYLKSRGTLNLVFDPYNRSEAVNGDTLNYLRSGYKADTATCANVLNVIKEADARANVILEVAKAIKPNGKAYFMVYEGDGSGAGKETSAGWQNNRKTADYMDEIRKYFRGVSRKGKLLIAVEPKSKLPKASWEISPGKGVLYSRDVANDGQPHPERWTATRVGGKDKAPKPVSEIIAQIRHDFGLNVTYGHVRGTGVRGQFNQRDKGIRSRIANDLPTVCHELGHALDDRYGILDDDLTKDLHAELKKALGDLSAGYKEDQYDSEGLAEFLRQFLQNRETAAIDYPEFTQYFLSKLDGKTLAILEQLADDVNAYYSLDADSAESSVRLREEGGADLRTHGEKIRQMGDEFYQAWIDANHGIKLFDEATGSNVYKLATNSAYSDAIAGRIITGDLTGPDGRYIGPGLKTALSGIDTRNKKEYKAFGEYLIVRHGPEYLAEGKRVFADDRKNSTAWMQRRQMELDQQYPKFEAAAKRLYQFLGDLNQAWGVETQVLGADQLGEWQQRWPNYVPFNRAISKTGRPGAKRGYANQSSPYKRAKGSGLDIVHPVDNIIDQIVLLVNVGVRNNVMYELRNAAISQGADATFMEKIPTPMVPKSFDMTGVKADLSNKIKDSDIEVDDQIRADKIISSLNDVLLQFGRGKAHGDVVTVMVGGKPEFWKINDKMLLESVTSLSPAKLHGFMEAYAKTTRFMTANITGNNPVWSIFSNAPRDLATFAVYSKDKRPFKAAAAIGSGYINAFNERFRGGKGIDPLYAEYLAMGGGHTSAYSADTDLARNARKKLTSTTASRVLDAANPINWVSFISDTIEQGPRFAIYKLMRQAGLNPQEAFYEAMDVTVNFRRGGYMSRDVNKAVPFFNASVQGVDKFGRHFTAEDAPKGNRAKVVRNRWIAYTTASAILATIMYALNSWDDDREKDYEQLSNYAKNSYWCIPLGDGKYFTIPKPREIAVMASFFETCMEAHIGGNDHAFDEFYDYATDNFLPSVVSDLAQLPSNIAENGAQQGIMDTVSGMIGSAGLFGVGAYMVANRDFLGKPIESATMQHLERKDRFNSTTSKMAYWLGQAFDLSPVMVDYFGNQVLGYLWKIPKALFPIGESADYSLGVQSTYIRDNRYSNDLVNWLYTTADSDTKHANSNPDSMDAKIRSKWDSNMTSFYSTFNKLAKDKAETVERRATRQTVLEMIIEYRKTYENNGGYEDAQKAVNAICQEAGSTEFLPSTMNSTIKDAKENEHGLSDVQYVEYQTEYLRLYWDDVLNSLPAAKNQEQKQNIIVSAKKAAKDEATRLALRRIGAPAEKTKYEAARSDGYSNVGSRKTIEFEAKVSEANDDGSLTQEEVIDIIDQMNGLSDDQRSTLFHSHYKSDKNNPWS